MAVEDAATLAVEEARRHQHEISMISVAFMNEMLDEELQRIANEEKDASIMNDANWVLLELLNSLVLETARSDALKLSKEKDDEESYLTANLAMQAVQSIESLVVELMYANGVALVTDEVEEQGNMVSIVLNEILFEECLTMAQDEIASTVLVALISEIANEESIIEVLSEASKVIESEARCILNEVIMNVVYEEIGIIYKNCITFAEAVRPLIYVLLIIFYK